MNIYDMHVAIAQKSGWKLTGQYWLPPDGIAALLPRLENGMPKLTLDFIHQAIKVQNVDDGFWCDYWDTLCDVTGAEKVNSWGHTYTDPALLLNPTAEQKLEVFCRVLWPEKFN